MQCDLLENSTVKYGINSELTDEIAFCAILLRTLIQTSKFYRLKFKDFISSTLRTSTNPIKFAIEIRFVKKLILKMYLQMEVIQNI